MVFGSVVGQVFSVSFLYAAISQEPYFVTFINLFVLMVVIWGSDHANDTPDQAVFFHITMPILSLIVSYAGFKIGITTQPTRSISSVGFQENIVQKKKTDFDFIGLFTIAKNMYLFHLFILSFVAFVGAVNLVSGRYEFGGGGMSQIGCCTELTLALGITLLILSNIGLIVTIYMASLDKDIKIVSMKYLILSVIPMLPWATHDFAATTLKWVAPYPNLVMIAFYIVSLIIYLVAIYFTSTPSNVLDPYYKNRENLDKFIRYIISFHFIGVLLVNLTMIIYGSSFPLEVAYIEFGLIIIYSFILMITPINNDIK